MTVRRFYCRNRLCERKVFAERLPHFVKPWARMTIRLNEHLQAVGLATSGRGGMKLAVRLGMQTNRQTLLRRIMALPDRPEESVLYLGIDDFAFRRGQRFGTVLVNLETHHIVDLLPDRQAATAAAWIKPRASHRGSQLRPRRRVCQSRSGCSPSSHRRGRPLSHSEEPDRSAPTPSWAES